MAKLIIAFLCSIFVVSLARKGGPFDGTQLADRLKAKGKINDAQYAALKDTKSWDEAKTYLASQNIQMFNGGGKGGKGGRQRGPYNADEFIKKYNEKHTDKQLSADQQAALKQFSDWSAAKKYLKDQGLFSGHHGGGKGGKGQT